jgi:hypothetical protein
MATNTSIQELAAEAARTIKMTLDGGAWRTGPPRGGRRIGGSDDDRRQALAPTRGRVPRTGARRAGPTES